MKTFLRRYNVRELKNDIRRYGYQYSTKEFVLQTTAILVFIFGVSYFSRLEAKYIFFLMVFGLLMIPFLIYAWFMQSYHVKRFVMLADYLSNILPVFMQKAKIRFALSEVIELTNGSMQKVIQEALDYIDHNTKDIAVHKTALEMIEKEFPNSRVRSVHALMLTIEEESSKRYHRVCENLYLDIENWIKRVYTFQKELKNRRNKLILLCILTLLMNCLFVYLYVSNDYFDGFTNHILYQVATVFFIIGILITITIILTRLHGKWLVDDLNSKNEECLKRCYDLLQKGKPKQSVALSLMSFCLLLGGIYCFGVKGNVILGVLLFLMAYLLFTNAKNHYRSAVTRLNKALAIEFPIWLREISLSLHNLTVLNAIKRSKTIASYPFEKEIDKFLSEAEKDPISIRPFSLFLKDFDLNDATSSMKVLYSIQNLGQEEVKDRVSSLILRNQEMLNKAESIRNDDSIVGIEAIGYIPIILFSIMMMFSMFLLFGHMMEQLSLAIHW